MFEDLITYQDLLECSHEQFGFGTVTFKRDFGPWKQGQTVDTIWVCTEVNPRMEEISSDGTVVRSCGFTLMPK